jgi:hypothetical protein
VSGGARPAAMAIQEIAMAFPKGADISQASSQRAFG